MSYLSEYESIVKLIKQNDDISKTSLYEELMKKEDKTIKLLNRIAEVETIKESESRKLNRMNISMLLYNFTQVWKLIIHDLLLLGVNKVTMRSFVQIFFSKDRQLYVGIMLVIISLILFFLDISS